jgi:hypothetical protein
MVNIDIRKLNRTRELFNEILDLLKDDMLNEQDLDENHFIR